MGANMENDMSKAINERRTKDKNAFIWYAVQTLLYPILVISFLICEEAGKRVGGILLAFVLLWILLARSAYRIANYIKYAMVTILPEEVSFYDKYKKCFQEAISAYFLLVFACIVGILLLMINVLFGGSFSFLPIATLMGIIKFILDAYGTSRLFVVHSYGDDSVSQYDPIWRVIIALFTIILAIVFFATLGFFSDFFMENGDLVLGLGAFLYFIYLGYRMDYGNRLQKLINRIEKNDGSCQEPM